MNISFKSDGFDEESMRKQAFDALRSGLRQTLDDAGFDDVDLELEDDGTDSPTIKLVGPTDDRVEKAKELLSDEE